MTRLYLYEYLCLNIPKQMLKPVRFLPLSLPHSISNSHVPTPPSLAVPASTFSSFFFLLNFELRTNVLMHVHIDEYMRSGQDVRRKIYQTKKHCLNLLFLTFRLTNAKFSGSQRPGPSRPVPCSLFSEQSESVSCCSTELHHSSS